MTIKRFLVVQTMVLLLCWAFRRKTKEKKIKICRLFSIQTSFWFSKPKGTTYCRKSSYSTKRSSKERSRVPNRQKILDS